MIMFFVFSDPTPKHSKNLIEMETQHRNNTEIWVNEIFLSLEPTQKNKHLIEL
jgi:hypothetical protein